MTEAELETVRRAFARQVVAIADVAGHARLEAAFAEVRRERFLGTDPWKVVDVGRGLTALPSNDPVYAYQDVLFSLSASQGINNGGPSLHARMLDRLAPMPGDRVVHVGAGTGYYTAILAHLVGERGRVTAIEFDAALGEAARRNLADLGNVEVVVGNGADWPQGEADRIYVNFATSRPAPRWIEALPDGGRLVLPLGVPAPARPGVPRHARHGAAFAIERRGREFAAEWISPAFFIYAEGDLAEAREQDLAALETAFKSGGGDFVKSLVWRRRAEPGRCWFWSADWALAYDEP
jgi:protein-L-isoaspartate(D-aspartate) O-methyltransferase